MKPGVYPEQVTIGASGTADAPFVLQAGSAGVVIDGADDLSDPAAWVQSSGDVWLAPGVTWNPAQVFADGARLAASTASPATLPPGTYRWVSGTGLLVNAGGGNPAGHAVRAGRRSNGFVVDGRSWVGVQGFAVTRAEERGIHLTGACQNVALTGNTVTFARRMGIHVAGGSGMRVESNTVSDNGDHGIALTGGASSCLVENNESFRNAHPATPSANGIYVYGSPGNTLCRNRLHDNQDTGLQIQSGSNDCVSYLNRSWSNGDHGYDHLGATGTIHVHDVAHGNHRDGFSIKGSSTGTEIHNSVATDNGLATGGFDLSVDGASTAGFTSDYNLFWNSNSQAPVRYNTTTYPTVAAYVLASGRDARSLQGDPRFEDPAAGDFRLRAGSPAIDNANSAAPHWPATDAVGQTRVDDALVANAGAGPVTYSDRGALELVIDLPPVVTVTKTATGTENSPITVSVKAHDPDGQPITALSATGLPAGARFSPGPGNSSGTMTWTPTLTQSGSYAVNFVAANTRSGSAGTEIMVANLDRAPVVTAPATVSGSEASPITITIGVTDADAQPTVSAGPGGVESEDVDEAITSLTADLSELPGATFTRGPGNNSGTLTWTPGYDDAGTHTVTFTGANALSGSASTEITVSNVDRAPTLASPGTMPAREGSPLTLTIHAADPDGQPISKLTASGLPPGARFSPGPGNTEGQLTWTPTFTQSGMYTVTFGAANAMSAVARTVITVVDVDRPPVVVAPATKSVAENGTVTVTVQVTDPDGGPLAPGDLVQSEGVEDAITSLTADLSGLPGATFTPGPGNTTGTLAWTPGYDAAGSHTVTFTAVNALSGSASTVISVGNVDRAPVITAPALIPAPEGSPLTLTIQAEDPDGEAITSLTASGLPAGARFTPGPGNAEGQLTWTPTFSQSGSYTVTFGASNAMSVTARTVIMVGNVDRAPVVVAPAAKSVAETGTVTVTVQVTDPDGPLEPGMDGVDEGIASLTADLSELPPGATFTPAPGNTKGTLRWTPGYGDAGSYTVTFTAANALSGSASTVITVDNVDRAPAITAPPTLSGPEAGPLTLTVHAVDVDGDAMALTADLSALPPGATFTVAPGDTTGTFAWTPGYADAGTYTVTFTAANALSAATTTTITVSNTDRAPVLAAAAEVQAAEAGVVTVAVHAADPDGDAIALTADLSGLPAGSNALFTADPGDTTGTLTWMPTYDDAGSYSVTFTAANALAASATTTITVTDTDRAPVVVAPASVSGAEATTLTVAIHAADPDGQPVSTLTADLSGLPAGHDAVFAADPGDSTGSLTWTPGYADAGSYTVTFYAANALAASAATTITVANLDRAPIVSAPAEVSAAEAGPLAVTVHASDPDGEPLGSLVADLSGLPPGATFTAGPGDSAGTLAWTPGYDEAGSYTVTFTAANALSGSAATTITVANTDRAPAVAAPPMVAADETSPVTVTVNASDVDGDAIASLTADFSGLPPGHDALFVADPGNTSGTLTWTPTFADSGRHTITFTAANALSGSAGTVITVDNVDRAPVLVAPLTISSPEASPLAFTVTVVDPDGDPVSSLVADLSGLPPGATFTVAPGNAGGTVTWTPGYFEAGEYTAFFFTAAGELSATAATTVTITNVDRAPAVVAPAAASVAETGTLTVAVHAGDVDGDPLSSLTADLSGLPAGHDATFVAAAGDSTGTLTWTPTYADSGSYSVTFTAANALNGSTTTVIHVGNVDRAPSIAAPVTASVAEASPLTITVNAHDLDGDAIGALTADLSGLPAGHDAVFTPGPGNTEGQLTWTPSHAHAGSYTVTFTATNALGVSATSAITVTNVDRAPIVAAPATVSVAETGALSVTVHAADPDGDAIDLLLSDLSSIPLGSKALFIPGPGDSTGTLTWTPTYQDSGTYTVTFTAANTLNGSAATTITVTNLDRPPVVAAPASAFVDETDLLTVTVEVADADGDAIGSLTADLSGLPAGSNASFTADPGNASGTLTWIPTHFHSGNYDVTFTAANALGGAATTAITVSNADRHPVVAAPAAVSGAEAGALTVTVHAADPDLEPLSALTADLSGLPAGHDAQFVVAPGDTTGTLTWTPTYADAGSYTVTFTGANALSASATTSITITNVDRAPFVSVPAAIAAAEAGPLAVTVHAADPDGQPIGSLVADLSGLPPGATFTPGSGDSTGTLSWTPGYSDAGSYTVTFTAANALSGSASSTITVANTDRAPAVAAPVTANVLEAAPLTVTVSASDVDGEPIASLTADFSSFPAGHNAVFTPGPGNTSGTLTWTPTYADSGSHTITFTAGNALSGSASTVIRVGNVDRGPVLVAPPTVSSAEASPFTFTVTAVDPDGDPVTSLIAGVASMPGATFTAGPGNASGTVSWTPGYFHAGIYNVPFFASAGGFAATANTEVTITNVDRAPAVAAPAAASVAETGTLSVTVHATDVDLEPISSLTANLSGLPAGHNAVFTPGPGDSTGTLTWTPSFVDSGSYSVTFTAANALSGSGTTVIHVSNVDRAPAVTAAPATVAEASPLALTVSAADVDGDAIAQLTADLSGLPAGHNAVFTPGPGNAEGQLTWTPSYDDVGSWSVTFTAANALSGSAAATITVTNTDRAPVVSVPALVPAAEVSPLTLTVTAADPDGQPLGSLTANLSGLPAGHDAVFTPGPGNAEGQLTWTPTYADSGSYSVTFTSSNALTGTATAVIHVANTDRAPAVTAPAAASVAETGTVSVTVNASDIDGDAIASLTANVAGLPAGHNAVFTTNPSKTLGTLTWTPTYDDAGSHTVTFTAANAMNGSASTVITVTNVDRAPVVTAPPAVSSPEGIALVVAVTAADPDGQPITSLLADLSGLPPGATFTVGPGNTSGTLTWTPGYSHAGSYSVTFFVAAGGLSSTGITAITITNTDRAPVVTAPAATSVSENGTLVVTVNATDVDGDALASLTANLSGLPAGHNAQFVAGPGNASGTLTWTPTYADSGSYSVTFTGANALSGSGTTVIHVNNVDRAPAVTAAPATVAEASPLSLTVSAADVDGDAIGSLTANLLGLPAGHNAVFTPGPGNATGTLTWTPTYNDVGSWSVTFTAANALSGSATATLTVTNTDRAPVVAAPALVQAAETNPLSFTIHAADPDGQPLSLLTADLSNLPAGHNAVFTPGPGDSTGTLTWTPTYADSGNYSVTFTSSNALSGSATAVIHVANTDRAPAVTAPAAATVAEAGTVSVTVNASDIDGDAIASLTANVAGLPAGHNAVFTTNPAKTLGTLTWTPTHDDAGSHTVTFTAANAMSGSAGTVITVTNVDRAPTLTAPLTVSSPEASPFVLTVSASDPDGQPVTSLLADLSGLPAGATFTPGPGNTTGTVNWSPGYNHAGSYSVTFFCAAGGLSATKTTAVTITNVDRAPVVTAPANATIAETGALSVTVNAADADGDALASLTANLSGLPAGHNAQFVAGPGNTSGTLTWTPTYADSGTYSVTFAAANVLNGSGTTVIHVTNVDRAPSVAAAPAASVAEAGLLSVTVTAGDVDGDAITQLTASLSGLPAGHNAVFTPGPGNTTGTFTWTPTHNDAGSYTVTFNAINALSASTATTITVTNTDRGPVVSAPAAVSVSENSTLSVTIHVADPDGDPITFLSADLSGLPAEGDAEFFRGAGDSTGTLTWHPTHNDAGAYTVTFTAVSSASATATTSITVTDLERAPVVAAPAAVSVAENGALSFVVHAADPDGQPLSSLTANLAGLPAGHNAQFVAGLGDSTGTLTWTPGYTHSGTWNVTFTATNGLSGSATTAITVTNTDRAPIVAAPAAASVAEAGTLGFVVHAADPDGQPLTLTADLAGLPAGHNASFVKGPGDTTGTLTWTPGYGHAGTYTVTFTAANALSGSGSTTITVTNTDRTPVVAAPAAATVAETGTLSFTVHAADPDGGTIDLLLTDLSSLPPGSNALFVPGPGDSTGVFTWTPGFSHAGSYTITFTAANALAGSASTTITVTDTDRAPVVAAPATAFVDETDLLSVTIHAADPDGQPLTSLTADLSNLPAGHGAQFVAGPGDTTGTLTWIPTHFHSGTYNVTFTAANALGGSATTAITVSNADRAPVVAAPAAVSVAEGSALTVTVHAADPDGEPLSSLTANLSGLPAGHNAQFIAGPGDTTGTLTWTPGYNHSGGYSVTFTAANALSAPATTTITVTNADQAPVVAAPSGVSVAENGALSFTVHAADPDGQPLTLAANLGGLPAGHDASFVAGPGDTTGTFTWTPGYTHSGAYNVAFTATNALIGSASTTVTVTNVDRAPVVAAPSAVSVAENGALSVTVHAADPDGQPLTSLTADLGSLPAGHDAVFTAGPGDTSGTLTWTPTHADAGSYDVTFTAANALSATAATAITVTDTDRAPVVAAPAVTYVDETDPLTITVHAADPDGQPLSALTADLSALPPGSDALFVPGPGDSTGTLTWTPTFAHAGNYDVTFTAANALGGSATTTITVSNVDRPPVVAAPDTASVLEGATLTITVQAADPDGEAISLLFADLSSLPPGSNAQFVPDAGDSTGTLTWTPTYDDSGSYTVTFIAANEAEGSATTTITVIPSDPGGGASLAAERAALRAPRNPGSGLRASAADALIDLASGSPSWKVTLGSAADAAGPVRFARVTLGFEGREIAASRVHPAAGDPASLEALFDRDELRILFAGLAPARRQVTLVVTGRRADGNEEAASLAADVVGAAAPMRPVVSPNPVRSQAAISFATSRRGPIRAELFDASGRRVRRLTGDGEYAAGLHTFALDGRDDRGSSLPAGMYFYRIVSVDGNATGRFVFLR